MMNDSKSGTEHPAGRADAPPPGAGLSLFAALRSDRLSLAILAAALLTMAALWLALETQISRERATKISDVMRENANLARAFDEHTVRTLGYIDTIVRAIQKQYEKQGSRFDVAAFYRELHPNPALLRNVVITDASGMIIMGTANGPRVSLADREHVRVHQRADSGQLFLSKPLLARVNKQWSIIVSRRASNPDGSLAGVVGLAVDPAYFSQFYRDLDLGGQGIVSLIGTDGFVRARLAQDGDALGQDISQSALFKRVVGPAALSADTSVTISPVDQVERIVASRRVQGYPLLVLVGVSAKDALASTNARAGGYRTFAVSVSGLISVFAMLLVAFNLRRSRAQLLIGDLMQRQRAIIDSSMDAIISTDARERIILFSAEAERMFLLSAAEAIGQPIERFIPQRYRQAHHGHIRDFVNSHIPARTTTGQFGHVSALRSDGTEFPIEASIAQTMIGGSPILIVTLRDISAREQAAAARRESEARYRTLVEHSPYCIHEINLAGRLISMNLAGLKMMGVENESAIQDVPYLDAVGDRDRERIVGLLAGALAGKGAEFEFTAVNGREFRSLFVPITDEKGAVQRLMGMTTDITAHAALEAQLRESQKMEAIGTLAGGIAHDFNNILAAILGNTQLAREDATGNAPVQKSLTEINKAAIRARDLVQQILSFSRRQPTERKVIALAPVVVEAERFLRATLPPRLTLKVHCATDAPAVLADATQMQQVIINLASNAMQAMRAGTGHIDIELDTVSLDAALAAAQPQLQAMYAAHPGRTLRLLVRDDGPGMEAATLARIFEPFFTTKLVDEGTGLGLSVVHGIVQTHEGVITAASAPGEGTTFSVYLSAVAEVSADRAATAAATARVAVTAAAAPTPSPHGGLHILYLDDDDAMVFLVTRLLERRGYRISAFGDQREALAALRADPGAFDLLLTDYNMPGMSGIDVAREAHAIRADLPLAIASGFFDETLREKAVEIGVRELIFKATQVEEFCEAVARVAQTLGGTAPRG